MKKERTRLSSLVYRVSVATGVQEVRVNQIIKEFLDQMKGDLEVGISVELTGIGSLNVIDKSDVKKRRIVMPNGRVVYTGNRSLIKFNKSNGLNVL